MAKKTRLPLKICVNSYSQPIQPIHVS